MTRLQKLQLVAYLILGFILTLFLSVIIGTLGIALITAKFIAETFSDLMELPLHIWNMAFTKTTKNQSIR